MQFPRASGILLHPTSLPSRFGCGDLGQCSCRFADFLSETGQHLWQMLPLGPTGYGNSPYQSLSVFAGNPLLISLERLRDEGWLETADLENVPPFPGDHVDYESVTAFRMRLLRNAFMAFETGAKPEEKEAFEAFSKENAFWLDDFSLFMAVRDAHNLEMWNSWEADIRERRPEAVAGWSQKLTHEVLDYRFQQYQFFQEWRGLKGYCNERGIRLIGDIPIFVALDSADVWAHPEMFFLDREDRPSVVAGVPPDYFSATGQLWGNPIYRWDVMSEDGYDWWVRRIRATRTLVDIIRLDHFRGFVKYWEVPGQDTTAINGRWVPGPGEVFFRTVEQALGPLPLIVEDLGVITPDVDELREKLGHPGMRVLQFAFGDDPKAMDYRPHSYPRHCVVYTGTHDNNTTAGWFYGEHATDTTQSGEVKKTERETVLDYLGTDGHEINWDFIRLAFMSVADTAVVPLQDVLGLGSEARMNLPGTASGNWRWRFTEGMLTPEIRARLARLTRIYGRA